jgi:hypothetical protein
MSDQRNQVAIEFLAVIAIGMLLALLIILAMVLPADAAQVGRLLQ